MRYYDTKEDPKARTTAQFIKSPSLGAEPGAFMRSAFLKELRPGWGTARSRSKAPSTSLHQEKDSELPSRKPTLPYPGENTDELERRKVEDSELPRRKPIFPYPGENPEELERRKVEFARLARLDFSPTLQPGWQAVRANSFGLIGDLNRRSVLAWLIPDHDTPSDSEPCIDPYSFPKLGLGDKNEDKTSAQNDQKHAPNAAVSETTTTERHEPEPVSPMAGSVQILSTPTADSPGATLLLEFANRRYLFGQIAEGTTRLLIEQKHSLTKLEHIFLTGFVCWRNCGGLFGVFLSVADVVADQSREGLTRKMAEQREKFRPLGSRNSLTIHGPRNLTHFMATGRRFVYRRTFEAQLREMRTDPRLNDPTNSTPDFKDDNIMVWRMCLRTSWASPGKRSFEEVDDSGENISGGKDKVHGSGGKSSMGKAARLADKTRELLQAEHQVREGVVKAMLSSGTMRAIQTQLLPDVESSACIFQAGEGQKAKFYDGPRRGQENCPDSMVGVETKIGLNEVNSLPRTQYCMDSTCYIVKCHDRRGRFNPDKAKALGVKTTDFKRLTNKETVAGKDGQEVTPEMVLDPDIQGRGFAVVDCCNEDHLKSLEARPEWRDPKITGNLDVMYWILNSRKMEFIPTLHTFQALFPETRHVILSMGACSNPLVFQSSAAHTIRLNQIDQDRFPLGRFENLHESERLMGHNTWAGILGASYRLAPRPGPVDSEVREMDTMEAVKEVMSKPEVMALAQAARDKAASAAFRQEAATLEKDMPSRDAEVITLGTGSAAPSKYRNVSATLVRVPGHGSYLFDCGENTLGQLKRIYGMSGCIDVLKDLRVIFISHIHADHHLGVANMIGTFMKATEEDDNQPPLCVMATRPFLDWLHDYECVEPMRLSRLELVCMGPAKSSLVDKPCKLFHSSSESEGSPPPAGMWSEEAWSRLLPSLGLAKVDAWYVDHTWSSVAIVLEWPTGLRVAYSGDCRPSARFAKAARDVDLLIHECTFGDDGQEHAESKKHSTMSEALAVARDCRARRVLLTHFSQRYPKMAPLSADAREIIRQAGNPPVLMAADGMSVRLGDFREAELFRPAIEKLYEECQDEGEGEGEGEDNEAIAAT